MMLCDDVQLLRDGKVHIDVSSEADHAIFSVIKITFSQQ